MRPCEAVSNVSDVWTSGTFRCGQYCAVDKTNIKSKPTTVSEHFLSHSNHSHTDMQLIPLEKIHSSRDSVRKARESHLIDKAITLESHGLNRRDELL